MKKIDRFDKYMLYKGLNDNKVTNELSLSIGLIGKSRKGTRDLSNSVIEKILNFYTDLSPAWLLTGEGEMLKQIQQEQAPGQPRSEEYWKELIASQQRTIESQSRIIEQQSRSIQSFLARAGSTEAV